jgi:hypothetical protein
MVVHRSEGTTLPHQSVPLSRTRQYHSPAHSSTTLPHSCDRLRVGRAPAPPGAVEEGQVVARAAGRLRTRPSPQHDLARARR